ncbi:short-chain fatty acids transporter [Breoghania corrubedonensis]|uniref:Short-chain fatty acids transporter n=1 Tax=Breoghania corrubedonensis TaxID=665038 RepID=A0A2T5USA8_9HYPH|nr:TIGR00366 family protein [Breoghania corrubedonensis]PTW54376.1 short-chain fatty acids transporter [Breoghania corrubedonensis]
MINKLLMFFVNLMQKYLPDPFIIAWGITLVVCAMALGITHTAPLDIVTYWGDGFFGILKFAMQMTLVVVTGYALAVSNIMKLLLKKIVSIPKTPIQTVLFVAFTSMVLYFLNWGLGLIAGALLAKEAGKQHPDVDFRLLVTAAFCGIIITHGGMSASVPLLVSTKGHFLEGDIGIIPLTQTIFGAQSLTITILLAICIPIACTFLFPKKENTVLVDPALFEDDEPDAVPSKSEMVLADRIDRSVIMKFSLALIGGAYLVMKLGNGEFNLNILIFLFLILGIFAHGSLYSYGKAIGQGASTCGGIILQFPFYAGIMGIMEGSGLVHDVSNWLLSMSNAHTFQLACYLSSLIISIFVPSAGGHWVVQAPFMIPAAHELGVEPWRVAMGVAWGESIWNIVCPFWALPVLAIAKVGLRDLIGFSVLLFIVGNIIAIPCMLLF